SDYMTLEHIVTRQHAAATPAEAARLTIAAGLDTEFPIPYGYGATLAAEVAAGRVDVAHVDASVRRVLAAKFRLGLFENPYPQETIDIDAVAREGSGLSRDLARRAVVVVKNDGILPLRAEASPRIALVGPHSDAVKFQFPTYSYPAFRDMTVFMSSGGMGNMVGIDPGMAAWNNAIFAPVPVEDYVRDRLGATSLADEFQTRAASVEVAAGSTLTHDLGSDTISAAVEAAQNADVVVLALGGASLWFNGERTEGEASDSVNIELPAAQVRLVEAVAATGTPLVVVLTQGRAYALPPVVRDAAAIVVAPYGGPFGPAAVAEVLFGEIEPSGKLPYSIPVHSGQVPVYHHQRAGSGYRNSLPPDVAQHYLDLPAEPLYAFGHGLGYTEFAVSGETGSTRVATDGVLDVAATVANTGERSGVAVVQLYLSLRSLGVSRPAQQLAGFVRVELSPGESRAVSFQVEASQFGCTSWNGDFAVEPGSASWSIGLASDDIRAAGDFEVTGPRRVLTAAERAFLSHATVS
ncbi:MAG TPA: glycoside hydrolase family 3 C-terminal domain-containing protein, partial [Pseudolysinimonas sp.]|nr:glycoside hydrolase family 3 C-terminal domain-containing protein [Pseudolysinimonas sp.]